MSVSLAATTARQRDLSLTKDEFLYRYNRQMDAGNSAGLCNQIYASRLEIPPLSNYDLNLLDGSLKNDFDEALVFHITKGFVIIPDIKAEISGTDGTGPIPLGPLGVEPFEVPSGGVFAASAPVSGWLTGPPAVILSIYNPDAGLALTVDVAIYGINLSL